MMLKPYDSRSFAQKLLATQPAVTPWHKPPRAYGYGKSGDPMQDSTHKAARARDQRRKMDRHNRRERRMNPNWGRC